MGTPSPATRHSGFVVWATNGPENDGNAFMRFALNERSQSVSLQHMLPATRTPVKLQRLQDNPAPSHLRPVPGEWYLVPSAA